MLNPSRKLGIFGLPEWGRSWSKKYQKEFIVMNTTTANHMASDTAY